MSHFEQSLNALDARLQDTATYLAASEIRNSCYFSDRRIAARASREGPGEDEDQASPQGGDRVRDVPLGPDRRRLWVGNPRERGIEWLKRHQFPLDPPTPERLRESLEKIAHLYHDAYRWTLTRTDIGERLTGKSMREYVKSWIIIWDIERLYGQTPPIVVETIPTDYTESPEIERTSAEDDAEDNL